MVSRTKHQASRRASAGVMFEGLEQRQLLSASLLKDVLPGQSGISATESVEMNGILYVATSNGLVRTDGTTKGTRTIASGNVRGLNVIGKTLYFINNFNQVWKTNGTTGGTQQVSSNFLSFSELGSANGKLFFAGFDSGFGTEIWVSNGTPGSTKRLKDINPSSSSSPGNFTTVGNKIYFTASAPASGQELWVSNGTKKGTILLKDINPGISSSSVTILGQLDDRLIFSAFSPATGTELYSTDGTKSGTKLLNDMNLGTSSSFFTGSVVEFKGNGYFIANGDVWKTNGTPGGTQKLFDSNFSVTSLNVVGNRLLWTTNNRELWRSNGSESSNELITTTLNFISNAVVAGNKMFFQGNDASTGTELWVTDGTENGTKLVKDINPGFNSSFPTTMFAYRNTVVFQANEDLTGGELYRSDGTSTGTKRVRDINKGVTSSSFQPLTTYQGIFVFLANDGIRGQELWKFRDDSLDFAGSTLGSARNMGKYSKGKGFLDRLNSGDTTDILKFTVSKDNTKVNFLLEGLDGNADLELIEDRDDDGAIDLDGGEVLESSKKSGKKSERVRATLDKGTYFIRVRHVSGSTDYSLKME